MSYQSTRTISRYSAIARIAHITSLAAAYDYRSLELDSDEPGASTSELRDFVQKFREGVGSDLYLWTNKMLEELLDTPFFRFSSLENYRVVDSEGAES